jgi:hypothetical protein
MAYFHQQIHPGNDFLKEMLAGKIVPAGQRSLKIFSWAPPSTSDDVHKNGPPKGA